MYRARSGECLFTHAMTKIFVLLASENTMRLWNNKGMLLINWEEKKKCIGKDKYL